MGLRSKELPNILGTLTDAGVVTSGTHLWSDFVMITPILARWIPHLDGSIQNLAF